MVSMNKKRKVTVWFDDVKLKSGIRRYCYITYKGKKTRFACDIDNEEAEKEVIERAVRLLDTYLDDFIFEIYNRCIGMLETRLSLNYGRLIIDTICTELGETTFYNQFHNALHSLGGEIRGESSWLSKFLLKLDLKDAESIISITNRQKLAVLILIEMYEKENNKIILDWLTIDENIKEFLEFSKNKELVFHKMKLKVTPNQIEDSITDYLNSAKSYIRMKADSVKKKQLEFRALEQKIYRRSNELEKPIHLEVRKSKKAHKSE